MEIDEKKILESINNPDQQSPDDIADHLEEIARKKRTEEAQSKMIHHGDIVGTSRAKGFKTARCPKCKVYLPVQFLRFDDKLSDQTIGYACSICDEPLLAITRQKGTGKVIRRYVCKGAKFV
jgi:predicted Zn-ribbon and HTH transcriptional regulator